MRLALLACLFAFAAPASADAPGVSGRLFDSGRFFEIEDAIAYRDGDGLRVAISTSRFDRFLFAADGRLGPDDLREHRNRHRLSTVEFELDGDGAFKRFHTAGAADVEQGRNPIGGWQPAYVDDNFIRARWAYGQSELDIFLPIHPVELELPGVAADVGAEPAQTLIAYIEARAKPDYERVLQLSHPPQRMASITDEGRAAIRKSIDHSLKMTKPKVSAVRVDGTIAEVHYSIETLTGRSDRRAFLARFDGQWIVQGIGDPRLP